MGGFINSVSQELLTKRGGSAVVAWMHVIGGMFEPIALFDLDVDAEGVDYLRRLESGPSNPSSSSRLRRTRTTSCSTSLRPTDPSSSSCVCVLVEGVAPTFIQDMNHDGRYTASDLRRMGFKVLSNEARLQLRQDFDLVVTETVTGRTCPPPSLIYRDLDGNGKDGAINCSGTGGATRIRPDRSDAVRRRPDYLPGSARSLARTRSSCRIHPAPATQEIRAHAPPPQIADLAQPGFPLRAARPVSDPARDRGECLPASRSVGRGARDVAAPRVSSALSEQGPRETQFVDRVLVAGHRQRLASEPSPPWRILRRSPPWLPGRPLLWLRSPVATADVSGGTF